MKVENLALGHCNGCQRSSTDVKKKATSLRTQMTITDRVDKLMQETARQKGISYDTQVKIGWQTASIMQMYTMP